MGVKIQAEISQETATMPKQNTDAATRAHRDRGLAHLVQSHLPGLAALEQTQEEEH